MQAANNQSADESRYGYIRYLSSQRMPTLREFFELFKDSGVVHDTEIKTNDPAIVIALHNLVNEYDNFGEVFTISFNVNILEEMYKSWPEMSVGALGMEGYADPESNLPMYEALRRDDRERRSHRGRVRGHALRRAGQVERHLQPLQRLLLRRGLRRPSSRPDRVAVDLQRRRRPSPRPT